MPPTDNRFIRLPDVGTLIVSGPDRRTWLQGMLTMDVVEPFAGTARYAAILDGKGRILADLHVFDDVAKGRFLLLIEAGRASVALDSLSRLLVAEDVELTNASAEFTAVTVQGPASPVVSADVAAAVAASYAHSRTGVGGIDLIVVASHVDAVTHSLIAEGVSESSLADLDRRRIEAGIPAWGRDFDDTSIPQEAGLLDALHWGKGCYVGQEVVARLGHRGQTTRELRRVEFDGPVIAGEALFLPGDSERPVGKITSAAGTVAIVELRRRAFEPGTPIQVGATDGGVQGRVLAARVRGHIPLRPENDPGFKAMRPQRGFTR